MNEKDILREAMKSCNCSQSELAKRLGYSAQSSVSNRLHGDSIKVSTFVKFLNALGYEVIVKSTSPNLNKNKWVVGDENTLGEEA